MLRRWLSFGRSRVPERVERALTVPIAQTCRRGHLLHVDQFAWRNQRLLNAEEARIVQLLLEHFEAWRPLRSVSGWMLLAGVTYCVHALFERNAVDLEQRGFLLLGGHPCLLVRGRLLLLLNASNTLTSDHE